MTAPVPEETGDDMTFEAAREALINRFRKGDLSALAEFFEMGGAKVKSFGWIDPPR